MESSRKSEAAHQRRLDECFDEMKLGRKFDSRQSTFLTDFEAKMRQVDLALGRVDERFDKMEHCRKFDSR
jgi:hypothetical protein